LIFHRLLLLRREGWIGQCHFLVFLDASTASEDIDLTRKMMSISEGDHDSIKLLITVNEPKRIVNVTNNGEGLAKICGG
jgi:hypothetical protein